jgi:hypoxanthine phosphoribosyltransferase
MPPGDRDRTGDLDGEGPGRRPYDYANRSRVRSLRWEEAAILSQALAEQIESACAELVVGVARAGLFPAFVIASALRREVLLIRVSRRIDDEVRFEHPVWQVPVPSAVAGKVVLVVDEIADTGETLALVRRSLLDQGAARAITAALVAHSWAEPQPDAVALLSDEFVVFPWDARILVDGQWVPHPEVAAGISAQHPPRTG